jgi:hypothetical protein
VAQIALGSIGKITIDPAHNRAYVNNGGGSGPEGVAVIDTASTTIAGYIRIPGGVEHTALDLVRRRGYVADYAASTVYVLDLDTNTMATSFPVGTPGPTGIAVDEATGTIYVTVDGGASHLDSAVLAFDGTTYQRTSGVQITGGLAGIAFDPISRLAYIPRGGDRNNQEVEANCFVSIYDTATRSVIGVVNTNQLLCDGSIAVDPAAHRAIVADGLASYIDVGAATIIDTTIPAHAIGTIFDTKNAISDAHDVAVDPSRHRGYVALANSTVMVVDLLASTWIADIPVGGAYAVAVAPAASVTPTPDAGVGDGPGADTGPTTLFSDDFTTFPSTRWTPSNAGTTQDLTHGNPAPSVFLHASGEGEISAMTFPIGSGRFTFSFDIQADFSTATSGQLTDADFLVPGVVGTGASLFKLHASLPASSPSMSVEFNFTSQAVTADSNWHHVTIDVDYGVPSTTCTWDGVTIGTSAPDSTTQNQISFGVYQGQIPIRYDNVLVIQQ